MTATVAGPPHLTAAPMGKLLALGGASIDGSAYRHVVALAQRVPGWLDTVVSAWSAYGLLVFALFMVAGWWRARRVDATAAVTALAVPATVAAAYGVDAVLKLLVHEQRPCRTLTVTTLEACPAPGDWSFPSNHAAIAAASAVALLFVSRRLGAWAVAAALAMAASRVWVGVHYPHDVLAGLAVGAAVAFGLMTLIRRRAGTVAHLLTGTPLSPLLALS
ncbi:phosphatase PAP2 family protein [Streptomyces sp. NPDC057253]|uniref:phosphatase PAP2 family protein n=1 Tax=Streptomyces sp. NPDC057253 TaxID=3346069 RepID=UPI00363602D9